MAERIIVRRRGNALVPVDQQGIDALHKLPADREMAADVVVPRNIRFHRKAFALLQLAFSYWEPKNSRTTAPTNGRRATGASMATGVSLTLPWPPSVNHYWRHPGIKLGSAEI